MSEAQKRNVGLQFLPQGMHRQRINTTWYNYSKGRVFWDVEWRFPGVDVQIIDKRVDEDRQLGALVKDHLSFQIGKGALLHKLKHYTEAGVEHLQLVMKRERCKANERDYHLLDKELTLRETLSRKVVVELPAFIVLLPDEMPAYPIHKDLSQGNDQQQD